MSADVFEREAAKYDAWYDTPEGAVLFDIELETLRPLLANSDAPVLEVGTGSGRFAEQLNIGYGVDPALSPLQIARTRGVRGAVAVGEALPFSDNTFGSVAFIFTLCFVDEPDLVVREAARVIRPDGLLVVGIVPADGPLGRYYQRLGREGHRIYQQAQFFPRQAVRELVGGAGLRIEQTRSAVMSVTDGQVEAISIYDGDHPEAGFLVITGRKLGNRPEHSLF